jgi:hypothetical protein
VVDSSDFPALGTINPGDFVDVYLEWTPDYDIPDEEVENSSFAFHTCLRVRLDKVDGETVLGNQDGDREQENVFYFSVPDGAGEEAYDAVIRLHNDDPFDSRHFYLHYVSDLPEDWELEINQGELDVEVEPNGIVDIPVLITSGQVITDVVGTTFGVDIYASALNLLASDLDPDDQHPENEVLGGVRVESRVVQETTLDCDFSQEPNGGIFIRCDLDGVDPHYDPNIPPKIMVEAVGRGPGGNPIYLTQTMILLTVNREGEASGRMELGPYTGQAVDIFALFTGTQFLSGATTGFYPIGGYKLYMPITWK